MRVSFAFVLVVAVAVLASAPADASQRVSSAHTQMSAARVVQFGASVLTAAQRSRRDITGGGDGGDNPFAQYLKKECITGLKAVQLVKFVTKCSDVLINVVGPLAGNLTSSLSNGCVTNPQACETDDVDKLLESATRYADELRTMVDELCKDKGDDYRCYDELLGLIRECVNFEAASITDDSLPGDLTIDDILDAAELMCHYNEKGQSCGVRIFEITSIEGTLEQVQGGALCSDKVCTPGCYEFLSELNKNLGCCWAELLTIASKVMGTDALLEDGTLPVNEVVWGLCGIEQPKKNCDGKVVQLPTPKPDGKHHSPTAAPQKGGGGGGGSDDDSSNGGKSTIAVVGGVIGATLVVLVLVAAAVIYTRRRRGRTGMAVYQPVAALSDADFDDSDLEADLDA